MSTDPSWIVIDDDDEDEAANLMQNVQASSSSKKVKSKKKNKKVIKAAVVVDQDETIDEDNLNFELDEEDYQQETPISKKKRKNKKLKKQKLENPVNLVEEETDEIEMIDVNDSDIVELNVPEIQNKNTKISKKKKSKKRLISEESEDELSSVLQNSFLDEDGDETTLDNSEASDFVMFDDGVYYRRHNEKNEANSILLILREGNRVYFNGKAELLVLKGTIEVYGAILTKDNLKPIKMFSPKGHSSLLYIEAKEGILNDNTDDFSASFPFAICAVIIQVFENQWTFGLRSTASNGVALLGPEIRAGPLTHPERLEDNEDEIEETETVEIHSQRLPKMKQFLDKFGFQFIPTKLLDKNRLLVTDPNWEALFRHIFDSPSPQRICVLGGKSVGKSTFCRWFLNKFISSGERDRILYLDLDPGQTEFNPPGVLALHLISEPILGPNFTHLKDAESAIFLGGVNVADFPISYLKAVTQLASNAVELSNSLKVPLIINTMGFCSGLGIPLAVSVVKIIHPSVVIQLTVNDRKRCFPFDLNAQQISTQEIPFYLTTALPFLSQCWNIGMEYEFIKIVSVNGREDNSKGNHNLATDNPRSLRETMLISFFSELIGSARELSLQSVVPFRINLNQITLGTMNSNLDWYGILRSILGNLVALCKLTLPQNENVSSGQRSIPNCDAYVLSTEFLSYAICRAYDKQEDTLFLVTPLSEEKLKEVNTIICAGEIGLPLPLLLDGKKNKAQCGPYISGYQSRLNVASKKTFLPGKRSTHVVLKNSLLQ